jgi:hypothetical protein
MRVQRLRGRPILDFAWGRVCGWVADLAIDPAEARVAAVQVRLADDGQVTWFEQFPAWWSRRHKSLLESEPEYWVPAEPRPEWITLDALPQLVLARADGRARQVFDAECDLRTWEITAYLRPRRWWSPERWSRVAPEEVAIGNADAQITTAVLDRSTLAHGV